MSGNDYIAEYVRQKHPGLLGIDFTIWKAARMFENGIKAMGKLLKVTPNVDLDIGEVDTEDDTEYIEEAGDEEDEDPENEMPEMQD